MQLDLVFAFPVMDFAYAPRLNSSVRIEKLRSGCVNSPDYVLYQHWSTSAATEVCELVRRATTRQAAIVRLEAMLLGSLVVHGKAHQKYRHFVHLTIGAENMHFPAERGVLIRVANENTNTSLMHFPASPAAAEASASYVGIKQYILIELV